MTREGLPRVMDAPTAGDRLETPRVQAPESDRPRIPEAYSAIVELAAAMGVEQINRLPGCWELDIDEHWFIAVNGHRDPTTCSKGTNVSPFAAYIEWCGWPAGEVDPHGGIIAAGEAANEDSFIAALRARTEAVRA